jgi:hypothetical protein
MYAFSAILFVAIRESGWNRLGISTLCSLDYIITITSFFSSRLRNLILKQNLKQPSSY